MCTIVRSPWIWNDDLIALPMIGQFEHLLTAGAFVQAFFPIIVFFALQRYCVRGILAGSAKG